MPGESFWNVPSGKGEDSDQDTFILVSSSDFDTQSSLENLSFVGPSVMATKFSGGSPDKPGPSGMGEGSRGDGRTDAGHSQAHGSVGHQGLVSGSSTGGGGGGGGDRRGGDRRLPAGDQNIEDDSHEPRASGSSTSSGSIQGLAPVDPALDINTADLWPNISSSERNGHSDESGLSHATTAIVSDSETAEMAMQNNPIVNPLLGSTSSSSTSTSGSKVIKSSSINLDMSSTTLSTLSSGVSSSSSFEEKKSITDTSLSRMDTSTIDISGDHTVEGLLANDGKLEEFHSSHIDIFNNSAERFTSTPAEEIGIIDFHNQTDMLETSDDNDMVIPSTPEEEIEKISFVIPNAPLPTTSGTLKRRAEGAAEENNSSRKVLRPTLKLHSLNDTKNEPAGSKKLSEKAIAMDKIGQFIERGLKTPESNETDVVEQPRNEGNLSVDDVESSANFEKQLPSTAISRKLLFESSQSSSDPSSSGCESSFQPVVVEASCQNNNENVTASVVPETGGTLISMVLEDLASLEEASKPELLLATKDEMKSTGKSADAREIIESSQESQNIIESSQPSVIKRLANKPAVMDKDNFQLRYSPTLQDMESQYFPFGEEDKPSLGELEPKLCDFPTSVKTVTKPNDEGLFEVPESEVSVVETFIHHAQSSKNEGSTLNDAKGGNELIIPSSLDDTVVPSTYDSQDEKNNTKLPIATVSQSDNVSKADVESGRPSDNVASGETADSKRDLEPSDEEDERLDEISRHKRRKLCVNDETPSLPSTSGTAGESTNSSNYRSKDNYNSKANESQSPTHLPQSLRMRDQEVQTIESLADLSRTPSGSGQSDSVIRRKTVLVKRIIIEEFIRNGRVYKKTTEEVNEDPLVTEYYQNNESPKTFVSPLPVEKGSPLGLLKSADSSSCISSTERSGTSSGWLGDFSASASKSSSSSSVTKVPTKGMTPRLSLGGSGDSPSSGSSLGMKTLRSDKSVPGVADDVASSTPKSISELSSKTSKGEGKGHKVVDSKRSPQSVDKGSAKRKKSKRKTKIAGGRNLSNEEKSPTPRKKGNNSDADKDSPPREQLILKLNLKSSSIVSPRFDDSRTLKPGVRVLAKYRDGYYYPGSAVDQERHDRWKILYDDGDTRSIRAENILVVELLPVGQSIYVLSQDGFYDSAIIVGYIEVNDEIQYAIEMDEGTKRQVKQKEVILTTDQAACMEKLPLGTMHGYTSICLDNIIEGKRRSRDLVLESSSSKSSRRERNTVSASPSTNSANDDSNHSSTHFKSSK